MDSILCWLTKPEYCEAETASSVITAIGPRAREVAYYTCLFVLSTNFRSEHKLRFDSHTQCSNCQHFGHHPNIYKMSPVKVASDLSITLQILTPALLLPTQ